MVHMASVWVPFTSESKEAIAAYPEIMKELRLGLQAVGRKLAMYLNRRNRVRQEGERREIFLRYLGEVATAVGSIKDYSERSRKELYGRLLDVAKRKTAVADTQFDSSGKKVESEAAEFGENVLIVNQEE
jgi:DNA topoisomerase-6 subunit B